MTCPRASAASQDIARLCICIFTKSQIETSITTPKTIQPEMSAAENATSKNLKSVDLKQSKTWNGREASTRRAIATAHRTSVLEFFGAHAGITALQPCEGTLGATVDSSGCSTVGQGTGCIERAWYTFLKSQL